MMRDLLERILLRSPEHENTGLESVSIIQVDKEGFQLISKQKQKSYGLSRKKMNPNEHRHET